MHEKDVTLRYNLGGLDLQTILRVLHEFSFTGIVQSTTYNIAAIQGLAWVYLLVVDGNVVVCSIDSSNGKSRFLGEDALHLVLDNDILNWTLVSQDCTLPIANNTPSRILSAPTSSSPMHGTALTSISDSQYPVPRRLTSPTNEQLLMLPRLSRMVFSLINGKRSTERIANTLMLPLKTVEGIVTELQAQNMVDLVT